MSPNTIHESSSESISKKYSLSTASTTTQYNNDKIKHPTPTRTDSLLSEQKTPWTSVIVTSSLAFCSAIQFSLYFSSTWPYLQELDPDVTEQFYGLVISAYSLGMILGAPLFGYWSNTIKNVQIPLSGCLACSLFGNFIYIVAQMSPQYSRYLVLIARFIVGIGAGNISILKSYVMMASNVADRSRAIALVTGGIATGSMCGPALQMAFTWIGYPGVTIIDGLLLNIYTLPAVAACLINLLGLASLWLLFVEKYAGLASEESEDETSQKKLPKPDIIAVLIVHATLFAQRFVFTNIETLGAPIGQSIFGWTKTEVVFNLGLAHSILSLVALCVNLIFVSFKVEKLINFRNLCMSAIVGLIAFHLITFDYPFLPGSLKLYSQKEYDLAMKNGTELGGCNTDKFDWCKTTSPLNVWVFYGAYIVFIGVCFPTINITLNTLFSKILGPRRIATAQGLLQMTGSVARLSGPLIISSLYTAFGLRLSWTLELIVLSIITVFWLKFYSRMVPLKVGQSLKSNFTLVSPSIQPVNDVHKGDANVMKLSSV